MTASNHEKTACAIIIGNEILSGRVEERNLAYIAKRLNEYGVRLNEARVIPDRENAIIATINECRANFDYVLTTGGIGPTHDDITAECVAKAFGVSLEVNEEARKAFQSRSSNGLLDQARLRMARIPVGGELIKNSLSVAPGFRMENVFVMAGVPEVAAAMIDALKGELFGGEPVRSRAVVAFISEGKIAEELEKIQNLFSDTDIGSYPFYNAGHYGTSLVVRSTNEDRIKMVISEITKMLHKMGAHIEEEV